MNGASLQTAYIPLPSGGQAIYTSSGLAYYRHSDHLGSSRFASTPTQTMYSSTAYSAFGEPYAQSGSTDASFTGQDQDTTSGVYDFLYRKFDPGQSRWTSPDPAGLVAVDPTTPQSWNRYAYVLNSPPNLVDPLGLYCIGDDPTLYTMNSRIGCEAEGGTWITGWTNCYTPLGPGFCFAGIGDFNVGRGGGGGGGRGTGSNSNGGWVLRAPTAEEAEALLSSKKADCLGLAAKETLRGVILGKEIEAGVNALMGDSNSVQDAITPGTAVFVAEKGLDYVAESRPLLITVREALREEGHKVSANALGRGAKLGGKFALYAHIALAFNEGREAYEGCIAY